MADSLDLDETNRIRVSLGMAPLPSASGKTSDLTFKKTSDDSGSDEDEGSTLESRAAAADGNWQQLQKEQREKRKRDEKRALFKKQRDAAQRFAKLEGKGLGDAEEDEQDTRSWLLGSQKRQKKIEKDRAATLAEEKAQRDREAARQYTSRDLKGAKVGHELDDIGVGEDQILTLKDANVDADSDEGDELENINLREQEKLRERLNLKKKKPVYDPNEVNEDGSKSILAQYDVEIDGKKTKNFTLDESGAPSRARHTANDESEVPGRTKISLDSFLAEERQPVSDYQDISEIKIKKPKKKKDKTRKRKVAEDDELDAAFAQNNGNTNEDRMDVDTNGASHKRTAGNAFLDDDEDLQAQLAASRRDALKKRKKMTAADIARELRNASDSEGEEEGGLVFDETSRFVENLKPKSEEPEERSAIPRNGRPTSAKRDASDEPDGDGDVSMAHPTASEIKREHSASAEPDQRSHETKTTTGLSTEKTMSGTGIGDAMALLRERGLLQQDPDSARRAAGLREQQRFREDRSRAEQAAEERARTERERDRRSGKYANMSRADREALAQQQNAARDVAESRAAAADFNRRYRPAVELRYTDEFGNAMDQKEAFKHLSHAFHGKGSGKGKMDKRLKRMEEKRAQEAASTLSGGDGGEEGARQRGVAGVRLQ